MTERVVRRYQDVKPGWKCEDRQYVEFTVNNPVTIVGFGLYGNSNPKSKLPVMVRIELINLTTKKAYGKNEATFDRDSDETIFRVNLSEPTQITPGDKYRAIAHFYDGLTTITYYGIGGCKICATDEVTFNFIKGYKKTVEEGQIPEIYYSL
uniref:PHR domain-containing protein n=1 Tax=Acrobeloides nanus TaxID=290746 RepID=A0A914EB65_9BILA